MIESNLSDERCYDAIGKFWYIKDKGVKEFIKLDMELIRLFMLGKISFYDLTKRRDNLIGKEFINSPCLNKDKTEKELKEELNELEYYQKRIEEIRGTSVFGINKKEMVKLQEELTECEKSFSLEQLEILKAKLKTLQERNAEVKQAIGNISQIELCQIQTIEQAYKFKKEFLKELGLDEKPKKQEDK